MKIFLYSLFNVGLILFSLSLISNLIKGMRVRKISAAITRRFSGRPAEIVVVKGNKAVYVGFLYIVASLCAIGIGILNLINLFF